MLTQQKKKTEKKKNKIILRDPGGQYSFVALQNPDIASYCGTNTNNKKEYSVERSNHIKLIGCMLLGGFIFVFSFPNETHLNRKLIRLCMEAKKESKKINNKQLTNKQRNC